MTAALAPINERLTRIDERLFGVERTQAIVSKHFFIVSSTDPYWRYLTVRRPVGKAGLLLWFPSQMDRIPQKLVMYVFVIATIVRSLI